MCLLNIQALNVACVCVRERDVIEIGYEESDCRPPSSTTDHHHHRDEQRSRERRTSRSPVERGGGGKKDERSPR